MHLIKDENGKTRWRSSCCCKGFFFAVGFAMELEEKEEWTTKNSLSAFACRHLFLCALKKWNQTCKEVAAKLSI